ncbi:MAG: RHS repeat domain-containing protein [Thermoanaerobaculia bacterium]
MIQRESKLVVVVRVVGEESVEARYPEMVSVRTVSPVFHVRVRPRLLAAVRHENPWSHASDADANLDRRGRLLQTVVTTGASSSLTTSFDDYDVYGTARSTLDPNGVETRRTLDARGRVTEIRSVQSAGDAAERADYVTGFSYDGRDRLTQTTLPLGNATVSSWEDGTNRLLGVTRLDASGNQHERVVYTLNTIGRKTHESYEECSTPAASCGSWVSKRSDTFGYDAEGRLVTVTHPDASSIAYTYDTRGNLLTVRDERHASANTIYVFDALNRLTSV